MRSGRAATLMSIAAVAVVGACALVFALTSFQQDFAAYWVAGAARRAGLDPYVNNAAAGAQVPWDGVAAFATAGSCTRRWRRICCGRWRRCRIARRS